MKFQDMIETSLEDQANFLHVITSEKSIKIDSFIEETDEYISFERRGFNYIIFKNKIIGFRSGIPLKPTD